MAKAKAKSRADVTTVADFIRILDTYPLNATVFVNSTGVVVLRRDKETGWEPIAMNQWDDVLRSGTL